MKEFRGKIAFITGGASGAGLGQAKVFSKAGMKVAIADVRSDALDQAVSEIAAFSGVAASDILPLQFDLTDRKAYIAAADKVEAVFGGPPHLLIQTAGVNSFGPAEASTFDDFDWVMGVCLNAVVNGLVIFVPRMIKAYAGKEECHVAATSSWGGWMGNAITAPYSAAKAAVNNLMESYYHALKPYGFGATSLCPMAINTRIYEAEKYRPAEFKESGYNWSDDLEQVMKEHNEGGMDPVELAEWLKSGIEEGQVYVIPYPNAYELISKEQERARNYASPVGMLMEEAKMKWMMDRPPAEAAAMVLHTKGSLVGFGKARKDIDWVDESHRMK